MKKEGIEKLLDQELVEAMKKRPGIYLGCSYKAIQNLLGYLFKLVFRNSRDKLEAEFIIEDDRSCCLNFTGGNLSSLKKALEQFIQIDSLKEADKYIYYSFFLFLSRIEVSLVYEQYSLYAVKEKDTFFYEYGKVSRQNGCILKFILEDTFFHDPVFLYGEIAEYVKSYAYQYPNVKVIIRDNREYKQLNTYCFQNGLQDQLKYFDPNGKRLWEERHTCLIDNYEIKICFSITSHAYIHRPRTIIYAEDDLILFDDETIKNAVISAMKQSMDEISAEYDLDLVFKEKQLDWLTDFVASIHGENLIYGGSWKTKLDMPELKNKLMKYMKVYFDELFKSESKYLEIIKELGFKRGNTIFLDACFPDE